MFTSDPYSLQVCMYYDDLEVYNKQKFTNLVCDIANRTCMSIKYPKASFTFMLGNIDPKYQSNLHVIQLVSVVETKLLQKHSIYKILEPFMLDIKNWKL